MADESSSGNLLSEQPDQNQQLNNVDSELKNSDIPNSLDNKKLFETLAQQLSVLTEHLVETNSISQQREQVLDRLHQENQKLRTGELQQAMSPLIRDLIRLYDDLGLTVKNYSLGTTQLTIEAVVKDFKFYQEMVEDILYRYGIEKYEVSEGTSFNPKEHRALAQVVTNDCSQDRTIAKVIRDGFRDESRVIRTLEAEVYRYKAEQEK